MQSSPQQSISIECCGETQDHTSKGWVSLLSISRCIWFLSFPWWAPLELICSLQTPDPNRALPAPHSVSWTEVAGSQDCINQISQNSHLRRNGWTQKKNQRTLVTVFQWSVHFPVSVPKYLGSNFTPGARKGKVCSFVITSSLGKTQSFCTQTGWLHLIAQSQSYWNSLASHAFWGYSLSTASEI